MDSLITTPPNEYSNTVQTDSKVLYLYSMDNSLLVESLFILDVSIPLVSL